MDNWKILNIVAFCVLMENSGGILEKSPDYVMEKFRRYCESFNEKEWMQGVDGENLRKLSVWAKKWLKRNLRDEISDEAVISYVNHTLKILDTLSQKEEFKHQNFSTNEKEEN